MSRAESRNKLRMEGTECRLRQIQWISHASHPNPCRISEDKLAVLKFIYCPFCAIGIHVDYDMTS